MCRPKGAPDYGANFEGRFMYLGKKVDCLCGGVLKEGVLGLCACLYLWLHLRGIYQDSH